LAKRIRTAAAQYDDALGKHDRSATKVFSALMDQARAQLTLVEDKLARSSVRAPFRAVIVSGIEPDDPVRQSRENPLELAPLDAYRIILQSTSVTFHMSIQVSKANCF